MLVISLSLCLFVLFYLLFTGEIESEADDVKYWFRRFTLPVASAGIAFVLGLLVCRTPLAGIVWAVGGWFVPGWVSDIVAGRNKSVLRNNVKSFITAAAGLYAAGQVTPEVIRTASCRFPQPLAGEFQVMLGKRNIDRKASFPIMFEKLAAKYSLPEIKAVAIIIAASEKAGGPRAAAEGLKHLALAVRARDRQLQERRKETLEPMVAAGVAILIIVSGFLFDVTILSHFFFGDPAGRIVLSAASALILIMLLMAVRALDTKDLMGGG